MGRRPKTQGKKRKGKKGRTNKHKNQRKDAKIREAHEDVAKAEAKLHEARKYAVECFIKKGCPYLDLAWDLDTLTKDEFNGLIREAMNEINEERKDATAEAAAELHGEHKDATAEAAAELHEERKIAMAEADAKIRNAHAKLHKARKNAVMRLIDGECSYLDLNSVMGNMLPKDLDKLLSEVMTENYEVIDACHVSS